MRPFSLKAGGSAASRRAYANITTDTTTPDDSEAGFDTLGARWLHLVFKLPDSGTSVTIKVFLWDRISEEWTLVRRLGAQGEYTLEGGGLSREILEVARADRVAISVSTSGALAEGLDVWLAGVS